MKIFFLFFNKQFFSRFALIFFLPKLKLSCDIMVPFENFLWDVSRDGDCNRFFEFFFPPFGELYNDLSAIMIMEVGTCEENFNSFFSPKMFIWTQRPLGYFVKV